MLHHANLLIGPADWAFSKLPKEHSLETQDVHFLDYDSMTIGNVRDLIKSAGFKSLGDTPSVYAVVARSILREAQNALLKLLEDPYPNTIFYFVIPREDILLPTLRSRFHLVAINTEDTKGEMFSEFLHASYAERLQIIETRLKQEDAVWISHIIEGLEKKAHTSKNSLFIHDVLMLTQYVNTKGSSKKMLLEHVSLSL